MRNYFFKCDVSGIQSFIFNVPGDGAARELKNRSVHVQGITNDCLDEIRKFLGVPNQAPLYNGGGNFYLKAETEKTEAELSDFIANLCDGYKSRDIFPYIAFVDNEGQSLSELFDAVNEKIQKAKLRRPLSHEKHDAKQPPVPDKNMDENDGVNGQVPRDKYGNMLDFDEIAKHSEGDEKLAALKLDVDNLGALFRLGKEEDYKILSGKLTRFFNGKNGELFELIGKNEMKQHVYTVFSGGDDCFLIGCWNKIFELAIAMRNEFRTFQEQLKKELKSLPEGEITFSAGIVVIHPKYPVIRMSEEVEEALSASKSAEGKNRVTVFGKTLSWNEFEKARKISGRLFDLIRNRDEPKNLIARIKSSDVGIDALQRNASDGKIYLPKVWRLKYYLRNVQKRNEKEVGELFDEYTEAVLGAFMKRGTYAEAVSGTLMKRGTTNPELYPVAARWAELLLKERETQ